MSDLIRDSTCREISIINHKFNFIKIINVMYNDITKKQRMIRHPDLKKIILDFINL